jgi:very-short-patch-repair endonuclease
MQKAFVATIKQHGLTYNRVSYTDTKLYKQLKAKGSGIIASHFVKEIVSVVDFYHAPTNTIIEIDGKGHFVSSGEYNNSTRLLSKLMVLFGYKLIRIKNSEKSKLTAEYLMNRLGIGK